MTTTVPIDALAKRLGYRDTWQNWLGVLKASVGQGELLTDEQRAVFRKLAERDPPKSKPRECHIFAPRRCGKDSIESLDAVWTAIEDRSGKLRGGEVASILCAAVDRQQAGIQRSYIGAHFRNDKLLSKLIVRETRDGLELSCGSEIQVVTSDFRSVRGRAVALFIADEACFFGESDRELYNAIAPALATLGGQYRSITTPYGRRGFPYDRWRRFYGTNDPDVLVVWCRDPLLLNPTLDPEVIRRAYEDDPLSALSEWGCEWRDDIAAYVTAEVLDACTAHGLSERHSEHRTVFSAFIDMSGGSIDSSAMCIAHRSDDGRAIIDKIVEKKAPHNPLIVVEEFCQILLGWRVQSVVGDRYAAEFAAQRFRDCGVTYTQSEKNKSQLYVEFAQMLHSHKVELLDHDALRQQLLGLERRVGSAGKDTVDHGPSGRDDVANCVAGAAVLAAGKPDGLALWQAMVGKGPLSGRHNASPGYPIT